MLRNSKFEPVLALSQLSLYRPDRDLKVKFIQMSVSKITFTSDWMGKKCIKPIRIIFLDSWGFSLWK